VGTIIKVGTGELHIDELTHALYEGRFERSCSVPITAPARGLVLHRVLYEESPFAVDEDY